MVAKDVELAKDAKARGGGKFATDTEISGGMQDQGGRELVAFQFDESVDMRGAGLDQGGLGWDQFKLNEQVRPPSASLFLLSR